MASPVQLLTVSQVFGPQDPLSQAARFCPVVVGPVGQRRRVGTLGYSSGHFPDDPAAGPVPSALIQRRRSSVGSFVGFDQ
jgi:hypothetical protein